MGGHRIQLSITVDLPLLYCISERMGLQWNDISFCYNVMIFILYLRTMTTKSGDRRKSTAVFKAYFALQAYQTISVSKEA